MYSILTRLIGYGNISQDHQQIIIQSTERWTKTFHLGPRPSIFGYFCQYDQFSISHIPQKIAIAY